MQQRVLDFSVEEQFIRAPRYRVVADSRYYLTARFSFGEAWSGLEKIAVFQGADGKAYHVLLSGDTCAVPSEVIKPTQFFVSVFGGERLTTDRTVVEVAASGFMPGIQPTAPTPDLYTQFIDTVSETRAATEQAAAAAERDAAAAAGSAHGARQNAAAAAQSAAEGAAHAAAAEESMEKACGSADHAQEKAAAAERAAADALSERSRAEEAAESAASIRSDCQDIETRVQEYAEETNDWRGIACEAAAQAQNSAGKATAAKELAQDSAIAAQESAEAAMQHQIAAAAGAAIAQEKAEAAAGSASDAADAAGQLESFVGHVAQLDENGKVPMSQLPDAIKGEGNTGITYCISSDASEEKHKSAASVDSSFELKVGAVVNVRFAGSYYGSDEPGEQTLNVDGTGPYTIKLNGVYSAQDWNEKCLWYEGDTVQLVFDGSHWVVQDKTCLKQDKIQVTGILKNESVYGDIKAAVAGTDYATPSQVDAKQNKITASGLLKGDGSGSVSAAVAGEDYAAPSQVAAKQDKITATGLLKGDGSGGISAAVAGVDYPDVGGITFGACTSPSDEYNKYVDVWNGTDWVGYGFTPVNGMLIDVVFQHDSCGDSYTPDQIFTLNVGGSGAKQIRVSGWDMAYLWRADDHAIFLYDAPFWRMVYSPQMARGKQNKITASGLLKGDGFGSVSAASAGTDYAVPSQVAAKQSKITASGLLKGDGSGGVSAAVAGTDYLKAETGTYTPQLKNQEGTAITWTPSYNCGQWYRIGKLCFFSVRIKGNNITSATGYIRVSVPFAPDFSNQPCFALSILEAANIGTTTPRHAGIAYAANFVGFHFEDDNATAIAWKTGSNDFWIQVSGCYITQ